MKKLSIIATILIFCFVSAYGQTDTIPDYKYYKAEFDKGTLQRNVGIGFVIAGPVLFVGGLGIGASSDDLDKGINTATGFFVVGIILEVVGITLCIAGGNKRRNNRMKMKSLESNMNLSFGPSRHGVSLTLRF